MENYVREIQQSIEHVTQMQIDFWGQLKEDVPDLVKVNKLGIQLSHAALGLSITWKKLIRMNLELPKTLIRTYARFLIDVLDDKEAA
jgi:hypothetical protein